MARCVVTSGATSNPSPPSSETRKALTVQSLPFFWVQHDPAVLQLHERLEAVRTLLDRPKLLPAHPRQVDDRRYPFRQLKHQATPGPRRFGAKSLAPFVGQAGTPQT